MKILYNNTLKEIELPTCRVDVTQIYSPAILKNTIIGPSHIEKLIQMKPEEWVKDEKWDWDSMWGKSGTPIYHKEFVSKSIEYSNSGKFKNIIAFVYRSFGYNKITDWMQEGLNKKDFNHQLSFRYRISIDKKKLKQKEIIDIHNAFLCMWLDWYVQNIKGIQFLFWCNFTNELWYGNHDHHLTHTQLYDMYKEHTIDLNGFKSAYDMSRVMKDSIGHPTPYGYECLREYLNDYLEELHENTIQ